MIGSNAVSATTCSVSGRWDEQTGYVRPPSRSASRRAAGARPSCSPLGSNLRGGACRISAGLESWIIIRLAHRVEPSKGYAAGYRKASAPAVPCVAEIEGGRGHIQKNALSTSELPPVLVQHCRISTMACFRSATFELWSCSRRLSGDVLKESESKGRRAGIIIKALQGDSSHERDEARWMREEQRWLREEERWQREEVRWSAANQALQEEVTALKKELEELGGQREHGGQITDTSLKNLVAGMRTLLQALASPGIESSPPLLGSLDALRQIPSSVSISGGASTAYVFKDSEAEVAPVTIVASPEKIIPVPPKTDGSNTSAPKAGSSTRAPSAPSQLAKGITSNLPTTTTTTRKRTIKSGMEGDDVKELQDALAKLGFYSGEEDVEFSMFSSGTARAVKTWQATAGAAEDGIVTPELMAILLGEGAANIPPSEEGVKKVTKSNSKPSTKVEIPSETKLHVSSNLGTREIDRYERSNAQETGSGSLRRVYLLGENRWEEPDRVMKKRSEERESKNGATTRVKVGVGMCFSCRGVGSMLCTDCEGTGDLNVEEQFLEWMEEGAKCPYCEGSGAVTCDVCLGEAIQIKG